jgi:hypothetical protein
MGDVTVQGFSLTPDEEKFFVRFLRQRALPLAALVSALAGGLTAAVLSCSLAPAPASHDADALELLEAPGLAPPLADEQARAELVALRKQIDALRDQPVGDAAPAAPDDARVAELRRAVDNLKRELQILATSVTELQRRSSQAPAAPDAAAPAELEPLRKRIFNVETRQDREEASRLEWAGNIEQRVRNLETARRSREAEQQAAMQGILDRLHDLEQGSGSR